MFRLIFFFATDYTFPEAYRQAYGLKAQSFLYGLWFDNVIACYLLLVPLVVMWVAALFNRLSRTLFRVMAVFFSIFYGLSFFIAAANIPYFGYFFKIINSSIFNWFEYGATTAGMVLEESSYYPYLFLAIVAIALWTWGMWKMANWAGRRCQTFGKTTLHMPSCATIFIAGAVCIGLCLFGIRGRRGYNPIKVSQAYYCEDPFLNQVGINPVFNLLTSVLDDQRDGHQWLQLMDENLAVERACKLLQRSGGLNDISPLAHRVENVDTVGRKNVVIVLMESMSAHLMDSFGAGKNLTPHLDSLYAHSLRFANFYSAGIHTNHGMYATLYSFPAILKRNAMKDTAVRRYSGLPTVLKENGYRNLFFMTHESQYDNMNAFFRTNGFDEIYSQEDYPKEKIANHFGVQDDYLLSYALPVLRRKSETGQPFLAVLLTISNHPPYVIPPYFHPRSSEEEEQIVEYADWAIGRFLQQASREPWFDNTLFVFLGDHGKLADTPECELPQSYNHIPLMIFGKSIRPELRTDFCGQIDVAPTLLGLLGISYTQNNLGIDLMREQRPCIYYTADDLIAARDSSHLYLYNPTTQTEFCYHTDGRLVHHVSPADSTFIRLKDYAFSMLQTAEALVKHGQTLDHPNKRVRHASKNS